jgi:hypothetical protein
MRLDLRARRFPRVLAVVFSVRRIVGHRTERRVLASTTVHRPTKREWTKRGHRLRLVRYEGRLRADLPAGADAREYASVRYRWGPARPTRTRRVSRRVTICPH